jgi:23S rRNA (adenine2503-C2)-methyltransferase
MLSDENGLNISQRNITVSTCGLVPEIYRLADESLQINLAISLHAATDEKRKFLMPIARKYSLNELITACQYYFKKTGRRITFEYSLIDGINDSIADANALKELMFEFNNPLHINLIPVNSVKDYDFHAATAKNIRDFKNTLEKYQNNVTIRRELGSDIDGACGQLRRRHETSSTARGETNA